MKWSQDLILVFSFMSDLCFLRATSLLLFWTWELRRQEWILQWGRRWGQGSLMDTKSTGSMTAFWDLPMERWGCNFLFCLFFNTEGDFSSSTVTCVRLKGKCSSTCLSAGVWDGMAQCGWMDGPRKLTAGDKTVSVSLIWITLPDLKGLT